MKTYNPDFEVVELVHLGNDICPPSDIRQLNKIGVKYDIDVTLGRLPVLQLWHTKIIELLKEEPRTGKFRLQTEATHAPFYCSILNPNYINDYIKYLGVYESEYLFLASDKWHKLHQFSCSTLSDHNIESAFVYAKFIRSGGDYESYISQYSKKHCDPSALKQSAELRKAIDAIMTPIAPEQKHYVATLIFNYCTTQMDNDTFHNILFSGQ